MKVDVMEFFATKLQKRNLIRKPLIAYVTVFKMDMTIANLGLKNSNFKVVVLSELDSLIPCYS